MPESQSVAERGSGADLLVLGVDTCGPSGSVALARIESGEPKILGQKELAGRTYSAVLVGKIAEVLAESGVRLGDLGAIVVVGGPGSFTGVRVGLSAVKGLAEPGRIPVVAVSRLAVLAARAGVGSAALDAHRHEVFLRVAGEDGVRELLAGPEELALLRQYSPVPKSQGPGTPDRSQFSPGYGTPRGVAVCDDAAEGMVSGAWGGAELVRCEPPTAADAIGLCVPEILAGQFADPATLDGHYLRRSDAEIFGGPSPKPAAVQGKEIRVRRMTDADVDAVMEIAAKTDHAPNWVRQAYVDALDPAKQPRRVALVAEGEGGGVAGFLVARVTPPEAELESIVTAAPHRRRGVARELFSVLKTELRRQGAAELMLEVREANHSALGFYRFLGFREEGRRKGYYADPVEDAVLMRLKLR